MKECVLLTGASSGIGYEMAKLLAQKGFDMVLVARNIDKLQKLKEELEANNKVKVRVISKDLSDVQNAIALYHDIKKLGIEITILINNAGVGEYGDFLQIPLEKELKMIELNISSLVALTKLYTTDMKSQNHGRVMNLCSLLSFFPFPYFSVYAATKAFVLSFTEAIRAELSDTNITVTALCPGPTDSAFTTDEMAGTNAYKLLMLSSPSQVAKEGIDKLLKGKSTSIIGLQNKILASSPRFSPRWLTTRINKFMASKF